MHTSDVEAPGHGEDIVVDSEDEREGILTMPPVAPTQSIAIIQSDEVSSEALENLSTILSFSTPLMVPPPGHSSISSFTTDAQGTTSTTPAVRERPRPRPAYKRSRASTSDPIVSTASASASPPAEGSNVNRSEEIDWIRSRSTTTTLHNDRKPLKYNISAVPSPVELIELSSDGSDDDLRLLPMERETPPIQKAVFRSLTSPPVPEFSASRFDAISSPPRGKRKRTPDPPSPLYASSFSLDINASDLLSEILEDQEDQGQKSVLKQSRNATNPKATTATSSSSTGATEAASRVERTSSKAPRVPRSKKAAVKRVAQNSRGAAEEVQYKSREFIEDSDEENEISGHAVSSSSVSGAGSRTSFPAVRDAPIAYSSEKSGRKSKRRQSLNAAEGVLHEEDGEKEVATKIYAVGELEEDVVAGPKNKGKNKRRVIKDSDSEDDEKCKKGDRNDGSLPVANVEIAEKQNARKNGARGKTDSKGEPSILRGEDRPKVVDVEQIRSSKENISPHIPRGPNSSSPGPLKTPAAKPLASPYTIRKTSTPMSELIRRVNSHPGSPFSSVASPADRLCSKVSTATAYSPMLKSSRSFLSCIAPLHPNRRPPPPPLPRAPPPPKTKKQLALEEKWEEQLAESVEGWAALSDAERAELRRAKWEMEMGGYD